MSKDFDIGLWSKRFREKYWKKRPRIGIIETLHKGNFRTQYGVKVSGTFMSSPFDDCYKWDTLEEADHFRWFLKTVLKGTR